MDLGQILGWITCSLSLISVWMTKNKWKWGFALGAGTQFIWIWLGHVRKVDAFFPMAVIFFFMYAWSFWTWHKGPWNEIDIDRLKHTLRLSRAVLKQSDYKDDIDANSSVVMIDARLKELGE